jgi:F-type H+-transporting ATPase subunit b
VIDWFTLVAQIVNFLILVGLLWHFLYKPIVRAMDEREKKIASRLEDAQRKQAEADEQVESYRRKQREVEDQREQVLAKARDEAEQRKKELIHAAREEAGARKSEWQQALGREQRALQEEFRRRSLDQLCEATRHVLSALADEKLEARMVDAFLERVRTLDDDERDALTRALRAGDDAVAVTSAFALPDGKRAELEAVVRQRLGDSVQVRFDQASDLVCGIELKAGGRKVSWNIGDYLDDVAEDVLESVTAEAAGSTGESGDASDGKAEAPDEQR